MGDLNKLKSLVFESDNEACFIERERILARLEKEFDSYEKTDKYAVILSRLLEEVSTPVLDCDYFAGRALEARPDKNMNVPSGLLWSTGHMSYNYGELLKYGLKGVLEKIKAAEDGTEASREFANNAEIVINAVKKFAERYSKAAYEKGLTQMGEALSRVPYEPAYDFYSALQSIWLMHFIASCYVGSRDYAFGRFDSYMLPFYKSAAESGMTDEEIVELLAGFFVKTNEICGRTTHNYKCKPIHSQASKQYVNIGGEKPNEFSSVVLKAAERLNMAQPQITVLLKPEADSEFTENVFNALSVLTDKLHVYNYELILRSLLNKGVPEEIARDFTFSACCTFDLHYHSYRLEYYVPVPQIFLQVMKGKEYGSIKELSADFTEALKNDIQGYVNNCENSFKDKDFARKAFVLDSILLTDTAYRCRHACDGSAPCTVFNLFCPGIATIGDSLAVIDKLCFKEKSLTYKELVDIIDNNFDGNKELLNELSAYVKFGNDTDTDSYTVAAGKAFLDAVDGLELKKGRYAIGGFYSLERDNTWAAELGATPDGRLAGEPFSENQSPSYGADRNGITALLKSVAKLPFDRTATGGLNLTFSRAQTPEILSSLIISYFKMGGLHVGISVVDADILREAMKTPEKYKSLTVRLYGFSEYFVSLPEWQQTAILNRTAYGE